MKGIAAVALLLAALQGGAWAGNQRYEPLSASAQATLSAAVADSPAPDSASFEQPEAKTWLVEMSRRMAKKMADPEAREDFLRTVYYEAHRAGLDPELVMSVIQVESGFRKYAVSSAGARGFMQVMPFWLKLIGGEGANLFHLRTNLRFGCVILRHYLDIEKGDLFRALGRYNGSLGKAEYPNLVVNAWKNRWSLDARAARWEERPRRARRRSGDYGAGLG